MKKNTYRKMKGALVLSAFALNTLLPALTFASDGGDDSYKQNFTITGYYSPLPNQNYYVTGGYESEIRLNGNGTHAADGTPVYPGMMAAPGNFNYGTKICLPNFGCGMIHDRGQAIVEKGERKLAKNTRLDLWMGYGDEGLLRALQWGVKHSEGSVHSPDSDVQVAVNFKAPLALAQIIDVPAKTFFDTNYSIGDSSEDVTEVKQMLFDLGFFTGSVTDIFNTELELAVIAFQLHHAVIDTPSDVGAGRFGPSTRSTLSDVHHSYTVQRTIEDAWNEFHFEKNLKRGNRNSDVFKLQQILVEEEILEVYPTGFFGPQTQKALKVFQIRHGIIANEYSAGAGHMGPQTMGFLNTLLLEKQEERSFALDEVRTYVKVKRAFDTWAKIPTENLYTFKH